MSRPPTPLGLDWIGLDMTCPKPNSTSSYSPYPSLILESQDIDIMQRQILSQIILNSIEQPQIPYVYEPTTLNPGCLSFLIGSRIDMQSLCGSTTGAPGIPPAPRIATATKQLQANLYWKSFQRQPLERIFGWRNSQPTSLCALVLNTQEALHNDGALER